MIKEWTFQKKIFLGNISKRWAYETEMLEATGDNLDEVKNAVIDAAAKRQSVLRSIARGDNNIEKV